MNFKYILKKLLDIKVNLDGLKLKNKHIIKSNEYTINIFKLLYYSSEDCNKLMSDWVIHFFWNDYIEKKEQSYD